MRRLVRNCYGRLLKQTLCVLPCYVQLPIETRYRQFAQQERSPAAKNNTARKKHVLVSKRLRRRNKGLVEVDQTVTVARIPEIILGIRGILNLRISLSATGESTFQNVRNSAFLLETLIMNNYRHDDMGYQINGLQIGSDSPDLRLSKSLSKEWRKL